MKKKDLLSGLELGHRAAERAAYHAGDEWKDTAYEAFIAYSKLGNPFTTEDVRAANPNIPEPPEIRAWGQVALRAKNEGQVKSVGITRAKSRSVHGMWVTNWVAVNGPASL